MTLIFSNDNRFLFNVERSNQILELCYGKRFTNLLPYEQLYNQASTSYKIYFEKNISANFLTNLKFDPFFAYVYKQEYKNWGANAEPGFTKKSAVKIFDFQSKKICKKIYICSSSNKSFRFWRSNLLIGRYKSDSFAVEQNLKDNNPSINQKLPRGFVKKNVSSREDDSSKNEKPQKNQKPIFPKLQTTLFDLVNNQNQTSLLLQSFSDIEIVSLYGFLKDQPILLLNFFKYSLLYVDTLVSRSKRPLFFVQIESRYKKIFTIQRESDFSQNAAFLQDSQLEEKDTRFSNRLKTSSFDSEQNFFYSISILDKKSIKDSPPVYNAVRGTSQKSKMSFSTSPNVFDLKTSEFSLGNKIETKFEKREEQTFYSKYQSLFDKKRSFNLCCKKSRSITPPKRLMDIVFIHDCFTSLKAKMFTIKRFIPKTRVWVFAFSSSFLVVALTSILQKQEQNRWFLPFSKNQMPGLSMCSQEISWECFENIILKHLLNRETFSYSRYKKGVPCNPQLPDSVSEAEKISNKIDDNRVAVLGETKQSFITGAGHQKYKYPSSESFVKQIDCYKDWCSLSFAESWNQQCLQNYTAVFSKSFDEAPVYAPIDIFFRFYPSQKSQFGLCFGQSQKYKKKQSKSVKAPIHFGQLFSQKEEQTISTLNLVPGRDKLGFTYKSSCKSKICTCMQSFVSVKTSLFGQKFSLPKKWLSQPWYKMHARVPPQKKELTVGGPSIASAKPNPSETKSRFINATKNNKRVSPFRIHIPVLNKNAYKEKVYFENDSIPSKISSSKTHNTYKPHDKLKELFYNPSNFSIEAQISEDEENSEDKIQESDSISLKEKGSNLKTLIPSSRPLFLEEKDFFEVDAELAPHQKTNFDYPLATSTNFVDFGLQIKDLYANQRFALVRARKDGSHDKVLKSKIERIDRLEQSIKRRIEFESNQKGYQNGRRNLSKSGEQVPTYFFYNYYLYKRNRISNRFMSGYQVPERKGVQLRKEIRKEKNGLLKICVKVPPALPFSESIIKKWELSLQNKAAASYFDHPSNPLFGCFTKITKKKSSFSSNLFENNLSFIKSAENKQLLKAKYTLSSAKRVPQINQISPTIRSFKKLPYTHLSLNEVKEEIVPLFDQVNKAFRVSPYRFTFKKRLFTDYDDYLSWSKDIATALSVFPSVEEEDIRKGSWFLNKTGSKEKLDENQSLHRLQPESENSLSSAKQAEEIKDFSEESESNLSSEEDEEDIPDFWRVSESNISSEEEDLEDSWPESESSLSSSKNQIDGSGSTSPMQEETESTPLSIDKEKEIPNQTKWISKFEGIKKVREKEHRVEKQKKLDKLGYPNRKALFRNSLRDKPGTVQSLLVSDRKLSFFGVAHLFPKRLVAQDQKQINSQILRDEEDRRSSFFLEHSSLPFKVQSTAYKSQICKQEDFIGAGVERSSFDTKKNNNIDISSWQTSANQRFARRFVAPDNKKDIFIENLLRSGALYDLEKGNIKKQKVEKQSVPDSIEKSSISRNGKAFLPSLQTRPRAREKSNGTKNDKAVPLFIERQHPIYMPHRGLRLRAPQLTFSSEEETNPDECDKEYFNLNQSHRWWQRRRTPSRLLGAPSKRYLVMPEIKTQDWKKIIEWQLKSYLLEEEKRLEPLVLEKEKGQAQKIDFALRTSFAKEVQEKEANISFRNQSIPYDGENTSKGLQNQSFFDKNTQVPGGVAPQTKHLFRIKRVAVYLPWTTLKKSVKKPFEWPLTGLSYQSLGLQSESLYTSTFESAEPRVAQHDAFSFGFKTNPREERILKPFLFGSRHSGQVQSFIKNKKPESCFISSISPHFKSSFFSLSNQKKKTAISNTLPALDGNTVSNGLYENSVYKPSLFETRHQNSYLFLHQFLLLLATQQLLHSLYKIGNEIAYGLKKASLAGILLPVFLNPNAQKAQIFKYSNLKKRFKDLVGNEETLSSLSEIIWYLRNACRGRLLPRGIILVETFSSESMEYLKAVGGEAQVPVLAHSLKQLLLTENYPQERLEKILTFAQKRAPCILFLEDLDSIGQSRKLLLKNRENHVTSTQTQFFSSSESDNQISESNGQAFELRKWKKDQNEFNHGAKTELCTILPKANPRSVDSIKQSFASSFDGRHRSTQLYTSKHPLWSKPFDLAKTTNERENKKDLQLSETEKIVEQRGVALMLRLLTVMDGITHLNGVCLVTTTKNPSSLDPALLRPGRFEKVIKLKLPNKKKRIELLKVETARLGHTNNMPWEDLATKTEDMTGTDISSVINHSLFLSIIQSTVHTISTLEYGISCVNRQKFPIEKERGLWGFAPQQIFLQNGALHFKGQRNQKYKQSVGGDKKKKKNKGVAPLEVTKPGNTNTRRSTFFRKKIRVHNPYKSVLSQRISMSTQFRDSFQKVAKIPSQIAFYQAGKGVVRSSILSGVERSSFAYKSSICKSEAQKSRSAKGDKICKKPSLYFKNHTTDQSVTFKQNRTVYTENNRNTIPTSFSENIVRLYGGQASESFYLDSISYFGKKEGKTLFSKLPFLQPVFSSKERLQASFLSQNITTNFLGSKATCLSKIFLQSGALHFKGQKDPVQNCYAHNYPFPKQNQKSKKPLSCKKSLRNKALLSNPHISPRYNTSTFLRRHIQLYADYERNDFARFYNRTRIHSWYSAQTSVTANILASTNQRFVSKALLVRKVPLASPKSTRAATSFVNPTVQKVSLTIGLFQRRSGNWYRLYLPKLEQNKNNLEWIFPDIFSNQHIPFLKQKDLQNQMLLSQVSSKVTVSAFSSRKKVYCSPFDFVGKSAQKPEKESFTFLSYYNMVLSAFYIAFQNCNENRELLDLLSDHLIRFKIARLDDIVRITSFYF